ncbi:hypothetical protein C483_12803 [Natrialba hulunbeirensis JCM 10989]|uniref:Uncharacterized protein n=1 Tax=Natrialba hulunbeirensis JCM 10989 TaxID=1227493 RepID=L9ZWE8_9EURY|nr:hypothetical protein C483_12803 [Natrialba hulunbeirensis JCM 10989]
MLAAHVADDIVAAGLDRGVQEVVEFVVGGEHVSQFLADAVDALWLGHADADAEVAVDGTDFLEESVEFSFALVPAVDAGVLAGDAESQARG